MKRYTIFLMLAACVVAIQACAPKAVIPSAARLSEKEYLQAIKTERKARQVLKTKAIAKQNNYYAFEKNPNVANASHERIASMIDSLVDARRFNMNITSATIDGKVAYLPKGSSAYTSVAYLKCDTLCLLLPPPFVVSTDNVEYQLISRTDKKIEIEMRIQESYETKVFSLTVYRNGRIDLYGSILSSITNGGRKISGVFAGIIEPLKDEL